MWAQLWSWVLSTYKANIGFSAQWPSHPFPLLFSRRTAASPADTHFIWIWKIPIKFPAAVSDPSVSCASSRGPGLKWCEGSLRPYHEGWTGQPGVWITFLDRIQPIFWRNLKIVSILLLVLYHSYHSQGANACLLSWSWQPLSVQFDCCLLIRSYNLFFHQDILWLSCERV